MAQEHGVYNVPNAAGIQRLQAICQNVLQPVRDFYARPVIVLRGYVSPGLNRYLDLCPESEHFNCCAVDFRVEGIKSQDVANYIDAHLPYDVVLLENFDFPWVHLTYVENGNRRLNLTVEAGQRKYPLSKNFSLWELVNSNTATAHKMYNVPDEAGISRLRYVCENILQPVREHFGKPVKVSSGYRSPAVNSVVKGSSPTSQHKKCEAADFEIYGVDNYTLADWIRVNLEFDQLILEHHHPELGPNDGWVHASYTKARKNRRQCLRIGSDGTFHGLGAQKCRH
ncbi:MAG: DUF882 domain-containing protein [Alphaproteobacteria bacterium]|nr:DUF882 domain-containing protein [Alphaproteobacteria bacterium]